MKTKRSLILISIIGLFLAFLFILVPRAQVVSAATVSPPGTTQTAPSASSNGGTNIVKPTTNGTSTTNLVATTVKPTTSSPSTSVAAPTQSQEPATTNTVKKEIPISGLTGSDAKITDMKGNPISSSSPLFTWDNYHVDYNWSIPDGVQINDGDTATFELPGNVISNGNLSFPIYDDNKVEIGTATIASGASTGTITFNNVLSNDSNRKGTLTFVSKGSSTGNGTEGSNWMFNKIGWVSSYGPDGLPDELTWNVAFNPNLHELNNVVITDVLGKNQEYIPGTLTASAGHYVNGSFVNDAGRLNPSVTTEDNKVIISFPGKVTTAVDIYYRVKVTNATNGTNIWSNHATMGSSEGEFIANADTSWGGSGTGGGEQQLGSVSLTKTDANDGSALAGAIYQLTDSTGKVIADDVRTDEKGVLSIKDLPYGDYVLTEVTAPDGYELNTTPLKFSIPTDGVKDIELSQKDDARLGSVVLKKLDPDTMATISGATFNLLDSAGNIIKQGLVTDLNGEISVTGLKTGEYSFVETQPAAGYEPNTTPINFIVLENKTTPVNLDKFNVATNSPSRTGSVLLTKYETGTAKLLPGAVYDIFDSHGNYVLEGLVTDINGQIKIPNLPVGEYSFVEVSAPVGYDMDFVPLEFTVVAGGTTSVTGYDPVEDVTAPPEGGEEPDAGTGSILLIKADSDTKENLAGAIFNLLDSKGNVIREGLVTNEKGKIFLDEVPAGQYSFVETAPAPGYLPDPRPIVFEVFGNMESPVIIDKFDTKAAELPKTGTVTLTKYDTETDEILPGATYDLHSADGTLLDNNLVTNEKGQISISGLAPGDYYLVETHAPDGYDLNTKKMKFTVVANEDAAVKAKDYRTPDIPDNTPGSVILTKADSESKNPLPGVTFDLLGATGELVSEDLTTDAKGEISVINLSPGKYSFVELTPAAGYAPDKTPIEFEIIAGEQENVVLTKYDPKEVEVPKVGGVTLTKYDAESNGVLPGAVYELHSANGTLIDSNLVSDEKGLINITDLEPGDYYLVETSAPDGYDLNTKKMTFTVVAGENAQVKGKDYRTPDIPPVEEIPGSVTLTKIDPDTKKALSGAVFNLLNDKGEVIAENLVTNDEGEISVHNLTPGQYSFVEVTPAAGYELNTEPVNFEVMANQTATVTLDKFDVAETVQTHSGNVILTKRDTKLQKALPGAIFDLLDSDGKVVQSNLVTDEKGQISIPNLEAGSYSFVETAAPEGYELNTTPIKFTITADQTSNVEAEDKANPEEPTGPETPTEPGGTTPPVTGPETPTEPGKPTPPTTGPETPTEPGKPVPPTTGPETPTEPGKPTPPTTGPETPIEPSEPVPPVTGPEEPSTTVPPVYPEIPGTNTNDEIPSPEKPGTIAPSPDEVLPPINSGNGSVSGIASIPGSSSSYGKNKFPQTGNESGLFMALSGLFIALVVLLKHLIKKFNY